METLNKILGRMKGRVMPGASGCLEWLGARTTHGYGVVCVNYRSYYTHRVTLAWATDGNLNNPLHALHSCNNPPCMNPQHLRWGTRFDNAHDRIRSGRHNKRKLTDDQAEEIRKLAASGEKQWDIADRYGVHQSTVWQVIHKKTFLIRVVV